MKITKDKLKQIIKEELESVLKEQSAGEAAFLRALGAQQQAKDPEKLEAAGRGMALVTHSLQRQMGTVFKTEKGYRKPPDIMVDGMDIFDWFAKTSGFSHKEIAKVARSKVITVDGEKQ